MLLVGYPCPSGWSTPALTEPEANNMKIMTTVVIMVKNLGSQEGDGRVGAGESRSREVVRGKHR